MEMKCDVCRKNHNCPYGLDKGYYGESCFCFEVNPVLKKGKYLCVRCGKRHKESGNTVGKGVSFIDINRQEKFRKEWENGAELGLCKDCVELVLGFIYGDKGV